MGALGALAKGGDRPLPPCLPTCRHPSRWHRSFKGITALKGPIAAPSELPIVQPAQPTHQRPPHPSPVGRWRVAAGVAGLPITRHRLSPPVRVPPIPRGGIPGNLEGRQFWHEAHHPLVSLPPIPFTVASQVSPIPFHWDSHRGQSLRCRGPTPMGYLTWGSIYHGTLPG